VDVNLAPRDELMRIPGVGEVTANAIIEARPFRSIDDLRRVRGIGAVTLERIRPYVGVLP
jgi:competence protein ComEA